MKQHEEISLFVKQVADKQHFPVFLWRYGRHCHAYSLYGAFPRNLGQGISVANSLGPRDPRKALATRNNEAYGQGNGRQSFRTVLR